ncbi:hypothetical protein ACHQM5_017238 [Ranunculus cassubicifolius]
MMMSRQPVCLNLAFLLLLFLPGIKCYEWRYQQGQGLEQNKDNNFLPAIFRSNEPQPFLPDLSPPPLLPFTNSSIPRLSGLCPFNFSLVQNMMQTTAIDCFQLFAPYMANVLCCPQLEATISILIGQSSKVSGNLSLDAIHAKHCLSDLEQLLESLGAASNLQKICSINPSSLTESSCPVKDINNFEGSIDTPKLLDACQKIDPVNECCTQICQNTIAEAAKSIASKGIGLTNDVHTSPEYLSRVGACKNIVLRWISNKLDPLPAKKVLRGLSNCKLNKDCPLRLPDIKSVTKDCANVISNKTACCNAMESYVSHLQNQSFVTNLQALHCAALFGTRLQKANITENVYSLCHVSLKDFSVQVGSQESGCLLPSLPTDAILGKPEISFVCDLNDNIAAPWPSMAQLPASSCKTIRLPALPAAASGQSGHYGDNPVSLVLIIGFLVALTALV